MKQESFETISIVGLGYIGLPTAAVFASPKAKDIGVDVNIAFANELSISCDKLGISVWELIKVAYRHPRVNMLQPGPGVGGHCIAVDPWFIVSAAPHEARLIVRVVNDSKPVRVIEKVKLVVADYLLANSSKAAMNVTITGFGLPFRPTVDDHRDSPEFRIIKEPETPYSINLTIIEPHLESLPSDGRSSKSLPRRDAIDSDNCAMPVEHECFQEVTRSKHSTIDTRGLRH